MAFRVFLHPKAAKALANLPARDLERIRTSLRSLRQDPVTRRSGTDIKRLAGTRGREDLFRLRIGTYRAVYSVRGDEVLVTDLFARGRGYEI
jgi:mRNA interferase RelE/StbE